jgi:hypothetical protein
MNVMVRRRPQKQRRIRITPPEPASPSPSISDTSDTSDTILIDDSNPYAHLIDIRYLPTLIVGCITAKNILMHRDTMI